MELVLTRIAKRKGYTIGRLAINETVDDEYLAGHKQTYFCDTLEPTWRDYRHGGRKIKGCSAIPEGRYPVVITYSEKFKQWLPILVGVPMFSGIRIHAGNTPKDTTGCILVGQNLKKGMVLNSNIWLKRLKDKIVEAKEKGETVWIRIKN
ncbi:MAG: hypothetical protein J6Y04_02920 [Bacteroidaceae bacterium]|nr:hypothetical protein [Bacteroidaceae bacterium]